MIDESIRNQIFTYYQQGKGSIQTLARIYGVSVEQVLEIVGEQKSAIVTVQGDMIDPSEAGPGASFNYGRQYKVPFDVS